MSEHLEKFKALTHRLHVLQLQGRDESEEAEAIREASDPHWYALTPEEQAEARNYSGGLDDNMSTIFGLTDKCPACGLPAAPGESCPHCQLLDISNPAPEMFWKQTQDQLPTSYNLDGPIHVHVGRWQNPGEQEGMWHVRVHDSHFFLPASLTDNDVLRAAEHALHLFVMKMARNLSTNVKGPALEIRLDQD